MTPISSSASPLAIRDSVARVLPAWDRDNPLTCFVLGQYAFGLEEAGELGRAEAGRPRGDRAQSRRRLGGACARACARDRLPAGGGHRLPQGLAPVWRGAHFMAGHNGWHLALYLIEEGRFDEVLADYDRFVAPKLADDATLDRIDAAALLWRLELAGVDVGARWGAGGAPAGWRMSTITCSPSTICISRSPPRARRDPDDVDARCAARSTIMRATARGDNREITAAVGRR